MFGLTVLLVVPCFMVPRAAAAHKDVRHLKCYAKSYSDVCKCTNKLAQLLKCKMAF